MKNITKIIISAFLIILLTNNAFGYAGMELTNNNTTLPQMTEVRKQDINNSTQSDQDIIMIQHLIELDALQLKAQNSLLIKETLIFRNTGTKDFYGDLRTWLPDGSENITLARSEMMTGGGLIPINYTRNGNIITWKEYVEQNSQLPFLYTVEYTVKQGESGKPDIETFTKKLAIPTYISYKYIEKPDLAAIIIKITRQQGSMVKFLDENGNKIAATEVDEKDEIFRFSNPQFKEINVEISQTASTASTPEGIQGYAPYIVIGILVILALLYPYIKKKLKSDKNGEETSDEPVETKEPEEIEEEPLEIIGDEKKENLERLKKDLLSKINSLEKEYESGNLLDEEYDDKKSSYQAKLNGIEKKLKKMV